MKKEIVICDHCGSDSRQAYSVTVDVNGYMDGAGSRETQQERVDLCNSCAWAELGRFLGALSNADGKAWVERVSKRKVTLCKG